MQAQVAGQGVLGGVGTHRAAASADLLHPRCAPITAWARSTLSRLHLRCHVRRSSHVRVQSPHPCRTCGALWTAASRGPPGPAAASTASTRAAVVPGFPLARLPTSQLRRLLLLLLLLLLRHLYAIHRPRPIAPYGRRRPAHRLLSTVTSRRASPSTPRSRGASATCPPAAVGRSTGQQLARANHASAVHVARVYEDVA